MHMINDIELESNKLTKINFGGGDLSSDGGLLLIKEFVRKIGFEKLLQSAFRTNDHAAFRIHSDTENLMQRIYQILGGYTNDADADELRTDPVFKAVLEKDSLASQPTMSRFFNRLDENSLDQFEAIHRAMRKIIYSIEAPLQLIFDLDSTLLATYGKQIGAGFNYHYQSHGYHPLLCFDSVTGDLLKVELRDGTHYCGNGAADFLKSLLEEYKELLPNVPIFLRGDSGFAFPDLYEMAEEHFCSYAIRLKANSVLYTLAADITAKLDELTEKNKVDYAVTYGEFLYQAGTWSKERRVACKVEKPAGQFVYMYTFVVTNMDRPVEEVVQFYCKRGLMENFIKEGKNGFDFSCMSSHSKVVNAGRLQICMLAYNLFNWFKRLVLPQHFRKMQIGTIRLKLLKIAARTVRKARYLYFRLCSSCPYQGEFYETLQNIWRLIPKLE